MVDPIMDAILPSKIAVSLLLVTIISHTWSIPIDNGVVGNSPEIECDSDGVTVNFNTENPFEGHVYVKGFYMVNECRTDSASPQTNTVAQIRVPFTQCGVRRSRNTNPAGLSVSLTIVISFHPMFITKVDRAYNIRCFYMEADKTVSNELEVSMLTTNMVTQSVNMPLCKYEVLAGEGPEGEAIKYAKIGDKTYHKWSCASETIETFCMTVHSCFVNNGAGKMVQLLDENGCAQDKYLLQNVEYTDDLVGGRESHVFKFADKPSLFFNCQIRLTLKGSTGRCERTSDSCLQPQRGRRDLANKLRHGGLDVDVYSEDLAIIGDVPSAEYESQMDSLLDGNFLGEQSEARSRDREVCFSQIAFGLFVTIAVVVALGFAIVLCFVFRKLTSSKLTADY